MKNNDLDSRLKQVYVTSKTFLINNEQQQTNVDQKMLPSNRKPIEVFEYGFKEPDINKIPKGKCTLRQSMEFISNYQHNPDVWTIEFISEKYQIKKEIVAEIVKSFRTFELFIPESVEGSVIESTRLMFAQHDKIILEDDDNSNSTYSSNDKLNKPSTNDDSKINTKEIQEGKK